LSLDGDRARRRYDDHGTFDKAIAPTLALAAELDCALLDKIPKPVTQRPVRHMDDGADLGGRGPAVFTGTEEIKYFRFIGHISAKPV